MFQKMATGRRMRDSFTAYDRESIKEMVRKMVGEWVFLNHSGFCAWNSGPILMHLKRART